MFGLYDCQYIRKMLLRVMCMKNVVGCLVRGRQPQGKVFCIIEFLYEIGGEKFMASLGKIQMAEVLEFMDKQSISVP